MEVRTNKYLIDNDKELIEKFSNNILNTKKNILKEKIISIKETVDKLNLNLEYIYGLHINFEDNINFISKKRNFILYEKLNKENNYLIGEFTKDIEKSFIKDNTYNGIKELITSLKEMYFNYEDIIKNNIILTIEEIDKIIINKCNFDSINNKITFSIKDDYRKKKYSEKIDVLLNNNENAIKLLIYLIHKYKNIDYEKFVLLELDEIIRYYTEVSKIIDDTFKYYFNTNNILEDKDKNDSVLEPLINVNDIISTAEYIFKSSDNDIDTKQYESLTNIEIFKIFVDELKLAYKGYSKISEKFKDNILKVNINNKETCILNMINYINDSLDDLHNDKITPDEYKNKFELFKTTINSVVSNDTILLIDIFNIHNKLIMLLFTILHSINIANSLSSRIVIHNEAIKSEMNERNKQ